MFNLLKSDMRRAARAPMFWIFMALTLAMFMIIAAFMAYLASPEFAASVNESIVETQMSDMSEAEKTEFVADYEDDLSEVQTLNDKVLESPVGIWSNFLESGFLGILGSCFVGYYLVGDMRGGFIKNLPMDRRGRRRYFAEKLIFAAIVQAVFVIAFAAFCALSFAAFGFTYERVESVGFMAAWLAGAWLVECAYAFMTCCVAWFFKREGIVTAWGLGVSSGVLGAVVLSVCQMAAAVVPWLAFVSIWTLRGAVMLLGAGEAQLLAPNALYPLAQLPEMAQVFLVGVIFSAVAAVVALAVCRKRDIR